MSEFKGTPGPWVVEDGEYVMDQDGNCIGAFGGMPATDKDEANAILCAAAPDLLDALQCAIHHVREQAKSDGHAAGVLKACDAAIAKALGQ